MNSFSDNQHINKSCLSNSAIIQKIKEGSIVISPFNEKNLNTSSYDVTLGEYYYRETPCKEPKVYNPYCKNNVKEIWGDCRKATTIEDYNEFIWTPNIQNGYFRDLLKQSYNADFGIKKDDKIILLHPKETILAHTNEFIGGKNTITEMMKARSSFGRNFIEVCKDAGWGDIGYINRWTMEITNNSQYYVIPLVVGRRIAQIIFFECDPPIGSYEQTGKYQNSSDINLLINSWQPENMLPKLYNDYEVTK